MKIIMELSLIMGMFQWTTGREESSDMQFDMSEYASGVYFIRFYDRERQRGVAKIITN